MELSEQLNKQQTLADYLHFERPQGKNGCNYRLESGILSLVGIEN